VIQGTEIFITAISHIRITLSLLGTKEHVHPNVLSRT